MVAGFAEVIDREETLVAAARRLPGTDLGERVKGELHKQNIDYTPCLIHSNTRSISLADGRST
jgi:hypothetical protein